jgi:aspartate/methionine/tyrosine aminotransferase
VKHPSLYLDWYIHVPNVKYDFRSSGIAYFKQILNLGEVDLSINYVDGNPEAIKQIADLYSVKPENVFISSEGASGQNARIIRYLAERNPKKKEAIVEYPTYEPLLRVTQEHFPIVKRLERRKKDLYKLDPDKLRRTVSRKTGLLVLTNPHAPSGAISDRNELMEIMKVANEHGFYVLCDEIYAEFDRKTVPTLFSVDSQLGIVTSSFTKAYGLGGLKLGIALAEENLVNELYTDVLNTVGNSPNVVPIVAAELLTKAKEKLQKHKQKWLTLKKETEKWLDEMKLQYFPNKLSVTYWVRLPVKETYKWTNQEAIPRYSLAPVPGAFFLFKDDYNIAASNMVRLGIGSINPENPILTEALNVFKTALKEQKTRTN